MQLYSSCGSIAETRTTHSEKRHNEKLVREGLFVHLALFSDHITQAL